MGEALSISKDGALVHRQALRPPGGQGDDVDRVVISTPNADTPKAGIGKYCDM